MKTFSTFPKNGAKEEQQQCCLLFVRTYIHTYIHTYTGCLHCLLWSPWKKSANWNLSSEPFLALGALTNITHSYKDFRYETQTYVHAKYEPEILRTETTLVVEINYAEYLDSLGYTTHCMNCFTLTLWSQLNHTQQVPRVRHIYHPAG